MTTGSRRRDDQPTQPPQAAIQAPWRQQYLENIDAPAVPKPAGKPDTGSFLRDYWLTPQDDLANHIVLRTSEGLILLNRYPYAGGHMLVCLGEARGRLLDYTPAQRAALWQLVDTAADIMERGLSPQGINIGINQGRAAGAGVPQHLHVHLVPRWGGDVNFMAAVGNVRVISSSLELMADRYRQIARQIAGSSGTHSATLGP